MQISVVKILKTKTENNIESRQIRLSVPTKCKKTLPEQQSLLDGQLSKKALNSMDLERESAGGTEKPYERVKEDE